MARGERPMEIIFISTLGFLISVLFLKHAPMHDIRTAIYYAKLRDKNERN